jgi:hypothetical protein
MKHLKKYNEELGPFHMDDEERAEYEKGRNNLNTKDIESKIQDAAYSIKGFGTMTKQASFINGANWAIHNLTDAEIKHMRENTDPEDHSFFGL